MNEWTDSQGRGERAIGAESIAELDAGEARRLGLTAHESDTLDVDRAFEALGDEDWRVRRSAARALGATFDMDIDHLLVERLRSDDAGERNAAMKSLIRRGDTAVDALLQALLDQDPDVRNLASVTLGQIGVSRATGPLLSALEAENDPNVVYMIVEALGRIGDPRAVPALLDVVNNGSIWEASPAMESLGLIGSGRAVDTIASFLSHPVAGSVAARALGRIGDPRALPLLFDAITSDAGPGICTDGIRAVRDICCSMAVESPPLCHAAGAAAAQTATPELLASIQRCLDEDEQAAQLVSLWIGHEELVCRTLDQLEDPAELDAPQGLTRPEALICLIERCAEDEDARRRRPALRLLAHSGDPELMVNLLPFFCDEDPNVRQEAATAAQIAPDRVLEDLLSLLSDPVYGVRDAAEDALACCTTQSLAEELITLSTIGDLDLDGRADRLLAYSDRPTPVPVIRRLLDSDDDRDVALGIREAMSCGGGLADRALQHQDDPRTRIRLALAASVNPSNEKQARAHECLLNDEALVVRKAALARLGDLPLNHRGHRIVGETLCSSEPLVVIAACGVAQVHGDAEWSATLESLCHHSNADIRAAALPALRRCDRARALIAASHTLSEGIDDWRTTVAAIDVMANEGVPELMLTALTDAVRHQDTHIASAAARALAALREDLYVPLLGELLDKTDAWAIAQAAFESLGPTAVPYLSERAARAECRGDTRAAILLGNLGENAAHRAVRSLIEDEDPGRRWAGILGCCSGKRCASSDLASAWGSNGASCAEAAGGDAHHA